MYSVVLVCVCVCVCVLVQLRTLTPSGSRVAMRDAMAATAADMGGQQVSGTTKIRTESWGKGGSI